MNMNLRRTALRCFTRVWNSARKGWPIRSCKGNALAGTLAGLMLIAGAMAASEQATSAVRHGPIHGTITRVDAPALRLEMRSDTGRHMQLAVANVDALRAVRRGEHVRADVDDHGVVLNIHATPLMPHPVSYSRG
jgi:hypothetical protein